MTEIFTNKKAQMDICQHCTSWYQNQNHQTEICPKCVKEEEGLCARIACNHPSYGYDLCDDCPEKRRLSGTVSHTWYAWYCLVPDSQWLHDRETYIDECYDFLSVPLPGDLGRIILLYIFRDIAIDQGILFPFDIGGMDAVITKQDELSFAVFLSEAGFAFGIDCAIKIKVYDLLYRDLRFGYVR
jgi:hypothetical protein